MIPGVATLCSPGGSLVATVLASALVRASVNIDTELTSEAVCWLVLWGASLCLLRSTDDGVYEEKEKQQQQYRRQREGRHALLVWIVSAAVVISALSRAVADSRWIAPILVPLMVALRGKISGSTTTASSSSRNSTLFRHTISSLQCFSILVYAHPEISALDLPSAAVLGLATVLMLTCLIISSSRDQTNDRSSQGQPEAEHPCGGVADNLLLSASSTVALAMMAIVALSAYLNGGKLVVNVSVVLFGGLCKAFLWVSLMMLSCHGPWESCLIIETLTLSWQLGLQAPPYIFDGIKIAAAGCIATSQLYHILPRKSRPLLHLLALFVAVCLLIPATSLVSARDFYHLPVDDHPAEQLHAAASANFDAMLEQQSLTLDEAVSEYRRRYSRSPPPGFDGWYEYARTKDAYIIDDYDTIDDGLRPLWAFSAEHFENTITTAAEWNYNTLRCGIVNGRFTRETCGKFGEPLGDLLQEIEGQLPNIMFAVNLFDEPNILPLGSEQNSSGNFWNMIANGPSTAVIEQACREKSPPAPRFAAPSTVNTYGLPFVTDLVAAKDLCRHPEYASQHGFLASPATFVHTSHLFPLLSRAAPHPFADILFPSPFYSLDTESYNAADDIAWDEKTEGVYWAGRSTGTNVQWGNDGWRRGHRQRLVMLKESPSFKYLTGVSSSLASLWAPFQSRWLDSWLFKTRISDLVQCSPLACLAQARTLRPSEHLMSPDPPSTPYRYRMALDIDGNSYSGRFYRLLASNSLTLKATIFREWHDDRLVPWLHYVPVGVGLEELPEIVRFFSRTDRGRALARTIADRGREWHASALRKEDMSVYMYRLILELARLFDPARKAGEMEVVDV